MPSPYEGVPVDDWQSVTRELIDSHPLDQRELVDVVLECWTEILTTRIADRLQVGVDVMLSPQMMGNFLHALVPVELASRYPDLWRKELTRTDKDIVFIPDDFYSIEVKTSSNPSSIFANRSYAQPSLPGTKAKDGFYLAINFEKFIPSVAPNVVRISFGWLDHGDWVPQASATGQQASLTPAAKLHKLIRLYG